MDYQNLLVEEKGAILYITINRPKSLNALNIPTLVELDDVLERHQFRDDICGAIITGSGEKAFAAGADIAEFAGFGGKEAKTMSGNGHKTFDRIAGYPKPVIAAVNGYTLGGGCELAMSCHMRIASENSKFGQPEVNLGLTPGYGGTQRLVQLVGRSKATELLLTGDMLNAHEALALGLVNHVVPAGEEVTKAEEIMGKISKKGPLAVAKCIELINMQFSGGHRIGDGFAKEVEEFGNLFETDDFKEGTSAFLEKRKPDFKGK